jgi:hypothetical protein
MSTAKSAADRFLGIQRQIYRLQDVARDDASLPFATRRDRIEEARARLLRVSITVALVADADSYEDCQRWLTEALDAVAKARDEA